MIPANSGIIAAVENTPRMSGDDPEASQIAAKFN